MGKLFLVHDLSPSRPWIHATLRANRSNFTEQGLVTGSYHPWTCQILPSHDNFWQPLAQGVRLHPVFKGILTESANIIRDGQDALYFSSSPLLTSHQSFSRLLTEETDIDPADVHALFIIGRPLLSLEQICRVNAGMSAGDAFRYVDAYGHVQTLIAHARKSYGHVQLLANNQETVRAMPVPEVADGLFAFLGRSGEFPEESVICHPLCFDSADARRLSMLTSVRRNSWPDLDEGEYASTLLNLDHDWGCDVTSSSAMRSMLQQGFTAERNSMEKELGLQADALAGPAWLLEAEDKTSANELDKSHAKAFARSLSESARIPLLQRYENDAHLLSQDQRILFEALKDTASPDFKHLGEPEAPVELTVLTMTYNHGEYIRDCLESVLAQKTSFPVRHLVLDHCSTDGTAEIVREYAAKHPSIRPVLLSRRQPHENVRGLFDRCRSKYAALCDGDDFYTDPLKLQKQVDFLENNHNCALCFHPVLVVFESGANPFIFPPAHLLPQRKSPFYYLADLTAGNFIQTNSAVYRWRFTEGLPAWFRVDVCPGDWYWHMLHAETGRIGYLPETMAIYRRHENALYANAFIDTQAHWRIHGMTELNAFNIYNEHFKNRYFRNFSKQANGIFASFLHMALKEEDSRLLDQATSAFPQFAREFFHSIKAIKKQASTNHLPHPEEGQ